MGELLAGSSVPRSGTDVSPARAHSPLVRPPWEGAGEGCRVACVNGKFRGHHCLSHKGLVTDLKLCSQGQSFSNGSNM